ncbi:hypothetical protein HDU97_001374 [Phlyctochytrium planicorne]|nr:hypothetical protein HDU97_001374 [Phlyctochytrium planicorne]
MLSIQSLAMAALVSSVAAYVTTPCTMVTALDRRLVSVAQYHSEDQAANNIMTHDSTNGLFWGYRLAEYFPNWNYLAENVARNSENETEIMGVWIRSPDHDRNLRDSRAKYFGSGYVNGFWTQDFGNSFDTDILFPIDCTKENGFAWPQPVRIGVDFVGTILTNEGLCLDAAMGRGGVLKANQCIRGNLTQSWTLKKVGSGFYAQQTGTNLCIDVFNQSKINGTVLGIWDCIAGAQNQIFVQNPQQAWIAIHSGLCPELANAGIVHPPGTTVTQWACNGGPNQRFIPTLPVAGAVQKYGYVGTIKSTEGLCLDAAPGFGKTIQANTCVIGRASQNWTLTQLGGAFMLKNTGTNNCVDLFSWNANNGATLGIYTCQSTLNQAWVSTADGGLSNLFSSKCIDLSGVGIIHASGIEPKSFACNQQSNQVWNMA